MRPRRLGASTLAGASLAALSGLHFAWARGSSWPFTNRAQLADAVAGSSEMPSPRSCDLVAAALAVSAGVVRRKQDRGPWRRTGANMIAVVLCGRGFLGLAGRTDLVMRSKLSDRFRQLDLRVYAPLCLALASAVVASQRHRRRPHGNARSHERLQQNARGKVHTSLSSEARRFAIISSASANGKTTLGRSLAAQLDAVFVEMDALVHGPAWAETPDDELRRLIEPTLRQDAWVIDGTYQHKIGSLVLDAADVVVWLDLPLVVWIARLLRRSAGRIVRQEALWNDNRETLRGAFWGRESLLVYGLRTHFSRRRSWPTDLDDYHVIRLRSPAEVDRWVAAMPSPRECASSADA